jgi:hypothetical protein
MLRTDFLILNEIRRELARTRVDPQKIQFSVTRGVIYFWGEFWLGAVARRLDAEKEFDSLVSALVGLEKRLKRVAGVVNIYFRFNNVQKHGGFWRRARVKSRSTDIAFVLTKDDELTEEREVYDGKDDEEAV